MTTKDFRSSLKELNNNKTNKTKLFLTKLKHHRNLSTSIPAHSNISTKKLFFAKYFTILTRSSVLRAKFQILFFLRCPHIHGCDDQDDEHAPDLQQPMQHRVALRRVGVDLRFGRLQALELVFGGVGGRPRCLRRARLCVLGH